MKKRYLLGFFLFVFLISLSLAVFLTQKNQETRSRANIATMLSFSPVSSYTNPLQIRNGKPVAFDILLDPGTNYVSIVKLQLKYETYYFEDTGANTLVINKDVLPTVVEGPVLKPDAGIIYITLSIGTDPKNAIKSPTKIATFTLNAIYPTTQSTTISFGPETQVYSVAPADNAFQNVLATATPAYISIANPSKNQSFTSTTKPLPILEALKNATNSPALKTPTIPAKPLTPAISLTPSMNQSPIASPSPTIIPNTPTPTPTTAPAPKADSTRFLLKLCLHGIGVSGDKVNSNISELSNKSPSHPIRTVDFKVFSLSNELLSSSQQTVIYNQTTGCFSSMVSLNKTLSEGKYNISIKSDGYIGKRILDIYVNGTPSTFPLPEVILNTGDINNDNTLNILDYNSFMGCYNDLLSEPSCVKTKKNISDLNDDTKVNQTDYNLLWRELGK